MTTFTDDFNRADGPPGNGWETQAQWGGRIASNRLTSTLPRSCVRPELTSGIVRVRSLLDATSATATMQHLTVKFDPASTDCYRLVWFRSTTNHSMTIYKYRGATPTVLATQSFAPGTTAAQTIQFDYVNGSMAGYWAGQLKVSASDNEFADHNRCGYVLVGANVFADDFWLNDEAATALDVTPEPIVQEAEPQAVQFTGVGTAWEPGTPGQPVFTVDKGVLSDQSITSATTGTATYTPPQADDSATFTDPSTGQTDVVPLSTGFQVSAGEQFSDEAVAYIEASAAQNSGDPGEIVSTKTAITPYGSGIDISTAFGRLYIWSNTLCGPPAESPPTEGIIYQIWRILNGGQEPDVDDNVFDAAMSAWAEATNAYNSITAWRTGSAYTAQDILDAIEATIPPDLSVIEAQLEAIRTDAELTLQDPIDAAEAVRGTGLPTIHDVRDDLADIRSPANLTLLSLYEWIAIETNILAGLIGDVSTQVTGVQTYLSTTLLNAITAIRGAAMRDLTQLYNLVDDAWDNLRGKVDAISASLTAHDTHLTNSTDAILDAIAALPQTQVDLGPVLTAISNHDAHLTAATNSILAAIAAIRPSDYPLWPGAEHATIGPPQQFSGALRLDGAMDGVLISIDVANLKQLSWQVDGTTNWKWAGYLAFLTDVGDAESHQYLGLSPAMYVPQRMLQASGVVVHLSAGVQATIRTWVYTP